LNFLFGAVDDPRIFTIDDAVEGGWIGRGLSAFSDVLNYLVTYTAYDPASGETSLRVATSAGTGGYGDWRTMEGPAGDFAAWTYLESFEMKDDQLVKISMLYYDVSQGALKRATWPPEPGFFLPVIR
jgi:hypothetical protein